MLTIFKQSIQPNSIEGGVFTIDFEARIGSKILSVHKQGREVCVWFTARPEVPSMTLQLMCVGTGFGAVPQDKAFIGTVVDGPFTWHFFADPVDVYQERLS